MHRKKGREGLPQSSPEREVEENQTELEKKGNMEDNQEVT
jgi:hypothetical protein